MHYTHNVCQLSLTNFNKIGFEFPKDLPLLKLADNIPWDQMIEQISTLFTKEGRNSKSIRMMLGLELAKTYFQVSDEMIVSMLKTDISVMYFCGFSSPLGIVTPDPSSLTRFRNRLNSEILTKIDTLTVQIVLRKLPPRKKTQVASDTTCLPANITYPTDTKILTSVVNKLDKVVVEIRSKGKTIVNRGKKIITKFINQFNKKRIKSKKEIKRAKMKLINQSKRLIRLIKKHRCDLSNKAKSILSTSQEIVAQQIIMYKNKVNKISKRIVSFHDTNVRPIFRGKLKATTEFGKKGSIMVVGQRVVIPGNLSYDNFSDTSVVNNDLKRFKEITNREPKEYSADRGMHSPKNHKLLKEKGCADGIQYKGKIPKGQVIDKKLAQRLYNNRSCSEGMIGTMKTRWGMEKIPYKSENTDVRYSFGILLQNFTWYVNN